MRVVGPTRARWPPARGVIDRIRTHLGRAGEGDVAFCHLSGHGSQELTADAFLRFEPVGRLGRRRVGLIRAGRRGAKKESRDGLGFRSIGEPRVRR